MPSFTDPPRGGKGPIRPAHLRLVVPKPTAPPRRRRGVAHPVEDVFAAAEVARLRLAFRNALDHFRTWERLADAMGVHRDTVRLAGVRHALTAGVAYRFAKATGTTIDAILATTLRAVPAPSEGGAA